jgi:subtilisin-like proprotein convertase family protein
MAKSYTSYLPAQTSATYTFTAAPATVAPLSPTGETINYSVSTSFDTVEFVVVFVSIDSTPGLPCNQIELTSPSGTKSILLHAANGFTNAQVSNTRFESNAFYGEPANGTWTERFLDFCPPSGIPTAPSTTQAQALSIAGY